MTNEKNTLIDEPGNGDGGFKKTELLSDTSAQEESNDPYKTGEFKAVVAETNKRNKILVVLVFLLIVLLAAIAYFLFIKKESGPKVSGQIRQMQEMAEKVQTLETDVKQKQDEIQSMANEYKEKTGGQTLPADTMNLSKEAQELMQKRIAEEKDVSVKSLLEDILDKNKEIEELKEKITEIEKLLPKPHIVVKGENHLQIAMDFLVNEKNLDKKHAQELAERAMLLDTMVPGFKVWNFYSEADDEYGTSVTQGSAPISPNTLIRKAKKKLEDSRDQAISERDKLAEDIKALEEKRNEIINQLDSLTKEKENLINQLADLNQQNTTMQQTINSVFFLVDTQANLKKKNILKGGFLKSTKLRDVSPELFTKSIDLRNNQQIEISAADLGVSKIHGIDFYPTFYREGTDYKVTISGDKLNAVIELLETTKFKNERLVIAIK